MSLEQIDTATIYDRKVLEQLSQKQLCKLLAITVNQLKKFEFSKENLIEMFLTNQPE